MRTWSSCDTLYVMLIKHMLGLTVAAHTGRVVHEVLCHGPLLFVMWTSRPVWSLRYIPSVCSEIEPHLSLSDWDINGVSHSLYNICTQWIRVWSDRASMGHIAPGAREAQLQPVCDAEQDLMAAHRLWRHPRELAHQFSRLARKFVPPSCRVLIGSSFSWFLVMEVNFVSSCKSKECVLRFIVAAIFECMIWWGLCVGEFCRKYGWLISNNMFHLH